MTAKSCLEYIVREIHITVVATVDDEGSPITAAIDTMAADEHGLYFLTTKGKGFYDRLVKRQYLTLTALRGENTMSCVAVSIRGKVYELGNERILESFGLDLYMRKIYPTEEPMQALTVFQIYKGNGECFDLSKKPIERTSFTFRRTEKRTEGRFITDACIGCGSRAAICPQNCVLTECIPYVIEREHCLHCRNCLTAYPVGAVEREAHTVPGTTVLCRTERNGDKHMDEKMAQNQRLDYLVEEFKADSDKYKDLQAPADTDGERHILRSLMNIRMPRRMDEAVLRIQDEYSKERIRENGIVKLAGIPIIRDGISVWQGDVTRLAADAIVSAASSQMLDCFIPVHACINNCIHTFADMQFRTECKRQMNRLQERYGRDYEQPTTAPILTDACNLSAKKVVRIMGPTVRYELTPKLEQNLADCYWNTLNMCVDHNLMGVAFCCISTGIFHFPNKRATEIAVQIVSKWVREHPGCTERVVLNVSQDEDKKYYKELM